MSMAWQGHSLSGWPGENRPGSLEEQQLLGSTDEGHATSKRWMDADHSDAEQQSSTVLRKRHCDDLGELDSHCWALEQEQQQQQQPQARQSSHLLKRVCSGLTSTSCEAASAQPCWAHSDEQQMCSEPCSPAGVACPSEASAPHCSARADSPTGSSPVAAAAAATAAAADGAPAVTADQELHSDAQAQQGRASTRASSSRSAAQGAGAAQDSVPAASSRASSRRLLTRKASDSISASQTNKACSCHRSSKASKGGSGSSSGSTAAKGPRVRLGGRLLSPEEAEKYLKEVAAAAQAAAAKAAAAKAAAAAAAAAAAQEGATAAPAAPAAMKAEPAALVRPPSPSLDAIAAAPAAAAEGASMRRAANCSPALASSTHGSSSVGAQAAAGSADQHYQQLTAGKREPMVPASAAALRPEPYHSTSALQQQHAAAVAAAMDHDALGVDVDDDDLDLSMLPEQLGEQLPEDFVPTPHQSSGWPSLVSTLGALDMPAAAAAAADATLIGSACSAAGCNADSLAAAVQEEEAAAQQQQQQMAFKSSPFLTPGACSAGPGSLACPGSMRSRDSSSANLCEAALLQRGSCNNSSMSSSSLAKSCSMPIRLSKARLSGPSDMTCFSGHEASSLARSGSASLSGLPGYVSMPMDMSHKMSANMSCGSLSTMHGRGSGAAMAAAYDPAAAAAAAVVAQQEEDRVDAELQQLLSHWGPDGAPAAAAAAPALSHQAMSAPAAFGGFSQQLSCSFPQQQLSMPLSMQGQQLDMSLGCGSSAAMSAAAPGFVSCAAPQQAPTQLAWKPAFAPAAPTSSSSGALSVTVPISVPAAGSALGLQCGSPFTSCSTMQGTATAPVQIAYPAGRQPRARKGKGAGSKAAQQQAKKQQQQQLTMQLQVPASALPAAVPPGARVVLHLKPNQQQQLMAVVDRLVQQRLAQTYEAGYRAAAANMGAGSMPPPAPVQPHQLQQTQQGQLQMPSGPSSGQMGAASSSMLAGGAGDRSLSISLPPQATASLAFGLQPLPALAAAAATMPGDACNPAGQMMMVPNAGVGGGVSRGLNYTAGQSQALLLQGMPRQCQLVDDILPSMQDLLTDCCE